ncbi:MAG: hypothetical protein SGARI_000269 [Bacillariaceae sp.]
MEVGERGTTDPEGKKGDAAKKRSSLPAKKRPWRKPKDMPKRPLSAYNLFFADERKKLLAARAEETADFTNITKNIFSISAPAPSPDAPSSGKKLGFAGLARTVAARWKTLDDEARSGYEKQASSSFGDSSSSGLVLPKGQYYGGLQDIRGPASAMEGSSASFDALRFPAGFQQHPSQQRTASSSSWTGPSNSRNATGMITWDAERGMARRLSSPGNISILAEELGRDQVDFFLNSLKEEEDKDAAKKRG